MSDWLLLCALVAGAVAACSVAAANAVELNVLAYGARADGRTVNTAAIQEAIDDCSRSGGGVVVLPAGVFVSGTLMLKSGVVLRLATNSTLLGSLDIADYRNPDPFISGNGAAMGHCFIGAMDAQNVGVEGAGTIDGRGKELLASRPKGSSARPFLMRFVRCAGVTVKEARLQGSAAWTLHFSQSLDVTASGLTIASRGLGNNDGIDVDSCRRVRIQGCDIDTGDDAICFKTTSTNACRDVAVTNCRLKSRWAAIKFGTESAGDFENIAISDCQIRETRGGGIKLFSVDGAHVNNISIANVTMEEVSLPIFIRLGARLKTFRAGEPAQPVGTIQNVVIRNVKARTDWPVGVVLSGIPGHAIEQVTLTNIEIHLPGGGSRAEANVTLPEKESAYPEISMFGKIFPAFGIFARHVKGLTVADVRLDLAKPDERPAVMCEDAENLKFTDWDISENVRLPVTVKFREVRQATLTRFTKSAIQIEGQGNSEIKSK